MDLKFKSSSVCTLSLVDVLFSSLRPRQVLLCISSETGRRQSPRGSQTYQGTDELRTQFGASYLTLTHLHVDIRYGQREATRQLPKRSSITPGKPNQPSILTGIRSGA